MPLEIAVLWLDSLFLGRLQPFMQCFAFGRCESLESITISESLRYDVRGAFDDAVLANITFTESSSDDALLHY